MAAEYRRRDAVAQSVAPREGCETLGGESAHLTGSLSARSPWSWRRVASPREVVICRELQTSDADAIDWSRLAAQSGAVVRWSDDAIEKSISPRTAAIVRAPDAEGVSLTELKPLALGDDGIRDIPVIGDVSCLNICSLPHSRQLRTGVSACWFATIVTRARIVSTSS